MNQIMKSQNIKSEYKVINYFFFVGLILILMAGNAYSIDLSISPTISFEEGELKLDRLKIGIAGEFFGVDTKLMLNFRQRGFHPEDIITARQRERIKLVCDLEGKKYQGREVIFTP